MPLMFIQSMFPKSVPLVAGLVLGVSMMMMTGLASADALKDEIAPTGKLRVAIAISPAGGAFWSTKNQAGGYAGVPVDLGKEMAAQLGVPVEYVVHQKFRADHGRSFQGCLGRDLPAERPAARDQDVVRANL
jgi:polar amino acid transport system substrate-binding protein